MTSSDPEIDYQRWSVPRVRSSDSQGKEADFLTVDDIEHIQKKAQQEGYNAGYRKGEVEGYQVGLATGQQERRQQFAHFQQILNSLDKPLDDLNVEIEQALASLISTVATQVVKKEIDVHPEQLLVIVQQALDLLPSKERKIAIQLNPKDVELINERLKETEADTDWQCLGDPSIAEGGCIIKTANTQIDATLEARMANAVSVLLNE